jgi:hypothetical protein
MPLQRRKKKKKAPPKKSGGMSQVQNVKVVVNAGPAPRKRRRAPAKKKDQGFAFGGGGGGGAGLAQVTYAPSLTQDVLQQSQELRQTIQQIQAGPRPGNNTILGEPGQPENPLVPDQLPVTRSQLKQVISGVIVHQQRQGRAMSQGFEEYKALAGSQLRALDESIHSLTTNKAEAPPVARSESRETLVQPPRSRSPTGRSESMAAEAGSPPPETRTIPRGRALNFPQETRDRVYKAWNENRQQPKGLQVSQEELALREGMPLTRFNNIKQSEIKKRGK